MAVIVVQLSDLHMTGESDPVLTRTDALVDAVKNLDTLPSAAVVAICGDVAMSGREEEHVAALEFIENFCSRLSQALSRRSNTTVPVFVCAVPGNHDCDFSASQEVRDILLEKLLANPTAPVGDEVLITCTAVQQSFFQFVRALPAAGGNAASQARSDGLLSYEYLLTIGNSKICVVCCNTAWMSRKHERQGDLLFPLDRVPKRSSDAALSIALLHHPYNWVAAVSAKAFQESLQHEADLILTGHEHEPGEFTRRDATGLENSYHEGGVLQDSGDPTHSSFNAFVVDIEGRKQRSFSFDWNGKLYARAGKCTTSNAEVPWRGLGSATQTGCWEFPMSEEFKAWLDDPGISITHRTRGILRLQDVFVWPDISEITISTRETARIVRGDEVPEVLWPAGVSLLLGESQSGKTSLAKRLALDFRRRGGIPILLDGKTVIPKDEQLEAYIEKTFESQYVASNLELYRQLDHSRRVIIVDDFHEARTSHGQRTSLLRTLLGQAGRIVLLSDDLSLSLEDLLSASQNEVFRIYRLQPFGHLSRNRLVEKWLVLGDARDSSAEEIARQMTSITRMLDGIIGKNFVPAYPVYVLAVLQAAEAATPVDTQASTHGYFYELLIKNTLARSHSKLEYDILGSYLAHFAYHIFTLGVPQVDEDELRAIHMRYERLYDVTLSFIDITKDLLRCQLLGLAAANFRSVTLTRTTTS